MLRFVGRLFHSAYRYPKRIASAIRFCILGSGARGRHLSPRVRSALLGLTRWTLPIPTDLRPLGRGTAAAAGSFGNRVGAITPAETSRVSCNRPKRFSWHIQCCVCRVRSSCEAALLLGNGGAVGPREGVAGQRTKNSLVYLCVDRKRSDVLVCIIHFTCG